MKQVAIRLPLPLINALTSQAASKGLTLGAFLRNQLTTTVAQSGKAA